MIAPIYIRDTTTGEIRLSQWQYEPPAAFEFWWTEGNGGCDCNRGLAFGAADVPCGNKRFDLVNEDGSQYEFDRESRPV